MYYGRFLQDTLFDHRLGNLHEAGDIGALHIVDVTVLLGAVFEACVVDRRHDLVQLGIDLLGRPVEFLGVLRHFQTRCGDAAGVHGLARAIGNLRRDECVDSLGTAAHVRNFCHDLHAVGQQFAGILAVELVLLGNSNLTEQGDVIFALGNIFGYAGGSGYGIVSSSNYKEIGRDGEYSVIATDMSSASEGTGILFNLDGEVIGMISSDIWKDRGVRTANAYAISDLKLVIQLLANGASVPYIGVSGTAVTSGIQKEEGMPSGIYVIDVAADSPAMAAGIQSGDVICSVNGEKIVSMSAYRKLMLTWKVGDQIKVEGKRRGSEGYVDIKFDVTIESKE